MKAEFVNSGPAPDHARVTRDTRTVFIYTPQMLLGTTDEDSVLPPGDYKIILPITVTDDGSVMGAPVPLAAPIEIPFTIVAE